MVKVETRSDGQPARSKRVAIVFAQHCREYNQYYSISDCVVCFLKTYHNRLYPPLSTSLVNNVKLRAAKFDNALPCQQLCTKNISIETKFKDRGRLF